ncbi:hypothetical protein SPSIL_009200 [Sporomusa silvacetica DSM 10669]|uniref:Uncharacterized protein n=1 Tax=Sporomusa silvacetica DSM 10669 TaxID=1123289 RepID=A0ABZ3IGL7_9FIRM|nr:hypothetical protein [Sporomusa silvacetica]OZC13120.1 hypothetical protein SPSIL_55760 [Sporomusa silvacetica DSM 10669]
MAKVVLIFVGGDSEIDKFIEHFSNGEDVNISHAAMLLLNSTLESTGVKEGNDPYPGVWPHDPAKYVDNPYAKFIEIEVPNLTAGEAEARKLIGTPYGPGDCFRAGVYEMFGWKIPDNAFTMDCSEMDARVVRAMEVPVLPELEPGQIAPARLFRSIMQDWQGKDVTYRFRGGTP